MAALYLCLLSGFRCGVNDIFILLGCYAAQIGYLPTFRDNLSVPSSVAGTDNLSRKADKLTLWDGTCPDTSVNNDEYTPRVTPQKSEDVSPVSVFHFQYRLQCIPFTNCGPGSSVGIATGYGLDGPGSNTVGDEIFRPSSQALGPNQPPVKCVPGLFPVVKYGRGVLLTTHPPSSAAVMEE